MEKRRDLGMPSHQYHTMLGQFKHREEQTEIQEALVYLKLREYQCDQRKALIFAKKYLSSHAERRGQSTEP